MPTDDIYGEIFDFDSDPYSEEADNIGYGSRLFTENTGSLLVYIVIVALQVSLAQAILKSIAKF